MTSFIEKNLTPGEKIIYFAKVHWMIYFFAAFFFGLGIASFIYGKYVLNMNNVVLTVITMCFILLGIVKFLQSWIHRNYTEIAITDSRLIAKFGFIRRDIIELPLAKIESVIVEQGIFERIIDAGSVAARGTGMALAPVRYIDSPIEFRNELNAAIARAKQSN